jgi:hypothetical protein
LSIALDRFVVHDVVDDDLKNTYIEIVVMDKGRLRAAQPLGQVTTRVEIPNFLVELGESQPRSFLIPLRQKMQQKCVRASGLRFTKLRNHRFIF